MTTKLFETRSPCGGKGLIFWQGSSGFWTRLLRILPEHYAIRIIDRDTVFSKRCSLTCSRYIAPLLPAKHAFVERNMERQCIKHVSLFRSTQNHRQRVDCSFAIWFQRTRSDSIFIPDSVSIVSWLNKTLLKFKFTSVFSLRIIEYICIHIIKAEKFQFVLSNVFDVSIRYVIILKRYHVEREGERD